MSKRFEQTYQTIIFLCINNESVHTKIKNIIPFIITQKKQVVNLTKHVQSLYVEKYNILMKKNKESLNKQKSYARLENSTYEEVDFSRSRHTGLK